MMALAARRATVCVLVVVVLCCVIGRVEGTYRRPDNVHRLLNAMGVAAGEVDITFDQSESHITLRPAHAVSEGEAKNGYNLAAWDRRDLSPCFSADTVNASFDHWYSIENRNGHRELNDALRDRRWVLHKAIFGVNEDNASVLDDVLENSVEYHEAMITLQLFAAVVRRRTGDKIYADRHCDRNHPVCGVAIVVESILANDTNAFRPPLKRASIASLRDWNIRSDNTSTSSGHGADDDDKSKAVYSPRVIGYFREQLTGRATRIADAIVDIDVYLDGKVSGRYRVPTKAERESDRDLLVRIYEEVVTPYVYSPSHTAPAAAKHIEPRFDAYVEQPPPRAFCAFAPTVTHACGPQTNAELLYRADGGVEMRAIRATNLCEAVVMCPSWSMSAAEAALLRGIFFDPTAAAGRLRVDAERCPILKDQDEIMEDTINQRLTRRRRKKRDREADKLGRKPDEHRAHVAAETEFTNTVQAHPFDVHMEISATPVAVRRGCLAAPLVVRGRDGRPHPLLRECMVIQNLPEDEQTSYHTHAYGQNLDRRADYEHFLGTWLRERIADNYTMPVVRGEQQPGSPAVVRPAYPRSDDDLSHWATPAEIDVVPTWCDSLGNAASSGGSIAHDPTSAAAVCEFLSGPGREFIRAAKHVLGKAADAAFEREADLRRDMDRLGPDMAQLQRERQKAMEPVDRAHDAAGGTDCRAAWCGGSVNLMDDQAQQGDSNGGDSAADRTDL